MLGTIEFLLCETGKKMAHTQQADNKAANSTGTKRGIGDVM